MRCAALEGWVRSSCWRWLGKRGEGRRTWKSTQRDYLIEVWRRSLSPLAPFHVYLRTSADSFGQAQLVLHTFAWFRGLLANRTSRSSRISKPLYNKERCKAHDLPPPVARSNRSTSPFHPEATRARARARARSASTAALATPQRLNSLPRCPQQQTRSSCSTAPA